MVQSGGQQVRSGAGQPPGTDQRGCGAECSEVEDCLEKMNQYRDINKNTVLLVCVP